MNPALLLLGHFLFIFFTWQQMVKHIHTHLLTLMLQHPEEPSRLLSQLFLFFTPNFYSSDTSFLTPRGCTWKWLLFRPYLTGKRPLLHKCGSKTHLRFVNNYSLSEFVIANIRHIFSVNFLFIIFFFFFSSLWKTSTLKCVERAVAMQWNKLQIRN